jgi:hypothetical protein
MAKLNGADLEGGLHHVLYDIAGHRVNGWRVPLETAPTGWPAPKLRF